MDPLIFEKGDRLYIVADVSPFDPGQPEIEEYAFAEQLKKLAPNENLMWLRGQYVEADSANQNGQQWTSGELAIKSLTPMLMPVTVMHDPRTAVGTIADAKLLTPDAASVPRSRIETSLALWKHRFPDVCEEVQANYEQGSLMQSMECISPHYSCAECGQVFQKLAKGAEQKNWCAHLREAAGTGARILGNVVFTGTGLIFGTQGARGAFDSAHLEVFQEEVAEAHDRAHHDRESPRKQPRRKTQMDEISIPRSEYAELQRRPEPSKLEDAERKLTEAEEAKVEAERKVEQAEAAQKKAEQEKADADKKLKDAEEAANATKLRDDRLSGLGKDFKAKLGEFTTNRLREDAGKLSDEEWTARLKEVSEMVSVEPDAGGAGEAGKTEPGASTPASDEVSREEVARSNVGGGSGTDRSGQEPSDAERTSVMRGLVPAKTK